MVTEVVRVPLTPIGLGRDRIWTLTVPLTANGWGISTEVVRFPDTPIG